MLLEGLEQQNLEAHQGLEREIQQLQQAKRSAKASKYSAEQALNHVSVLTSALNNAQIAADHAQQSATEAAAGKNLNNYSIQISSAPREEISCEFGDQEAFVINLFAWNSNRTSI